MATTGSTDTSNTIETVVTVLSTQALLEADSGGTDFSTSTVGVPIAAINTEAIGTKFVSLATTSL